MTIPFGFCEVSFEHGGAAAPQGAICTLGLEVVIPQTPSAVAAQCGAVWVASIMPNLSSALSFLGCKVKFGPDLTGPSGDVGTAGAGAQAGGAVPPNTAALILKRTALGGRAGRGRLFLPGLAEEEVLDGGQIDGSRVTNLVASFASLKATLTALIGPPVLLHNSEFAPSEITEFTMSPTCATQRRRLRR